MFASNSSFLVTVVVFVGGQIPPKKSQTQATAAPPEQTPSGAVTQLMTITSASFTRVQNLVETSPHLSTEDMILVLLNDQEEVCLFVVFV